MNRTLSWFATVSVATSLVYFGCGGDGTTDPPPEEPRVTSAEVASGNGQTGTVGQPLAGPLVVQVNDQSGNGMSGESVSFTVSAGGGTVSNTTSTTGAAGQASTTWTLGTVAGADQEVTAAVVGAANKTATFTATAKADVSFVISKVSGDDQFAFMETKVPEVIAVRVRDQYANNVAGQVVEFTLPTGRGGLDSTIAFTNVEGEAKTGWTVGSAVGQDTAFASVTGVAGGPVVFTATVHDLQITSVDPTTLDLGGNATVSGTGFDTTPANNVVTIGDLTAVVNSATETQLDIAVPDACRPAGPVDVIVTTGGIPSAPANATLAPSSFLNLSAGEQEILQDPADFCLQLNASSESESYLIGVQSTLEAASGMTPIRFSSIAAAGSAPPAAFPEYDEVDRTLSSRNAVAPSQMRRLARHRAVEARIRAFDRVNFERIRHELSARQHSISRSAAAVVSNVTVNDTIEVRVPEGETSCNSYDLITTVVRAVGEKGIWLEDIDNPSGGYTLSDFDALSDQFDDYIYTADTAQFGGPSDIDGNGRIVMVVTKEVNERGALGFTSSCDFGSQSPSNLASNEGEFFYGEAPDPNGDYGEAVEVEFARGWLPTTVAHELVHVIQFSGRAEVGGSFPDIWIAEGQATMGEEIAGHAIEGRSTGQNLGLGVAVNWDDTTSFDWYSGAIVDMAVYFGWAPTDIDFDIHLDEAPHECTWLENEAGGPCIEGREAYGVPWSLLRWLSDQYGPSYPGGEAGLQQDIIRSTSDGYTLLEQLVGAPFEKILAQWAASLYTDDRLGGANPTLTFTSWNLFDIFHGSYTLPDGTFGLREALRLKPKSAQYASFSRDASVRAGSTYYTLFSGGTRPGTAIWISDQFDATLPSHMQVWVVRMQ